MSNMWLLHLECSEQIASAVVEGHLVRGVSVMEDVPEATEEERLAGVLVVSLLCLLFLQYDEQPLGTISSHDISQIRSHPFASLLYSVIS